MGEFPEQLPDEPDSAYGHFCAWLESGTDNTAEFARLRGIRPESVRRLRSKWDWKNRRRPVTAAVQARTTELVVERTATNIADRAAKAWTAAVQAHSFLAAEVGNKAVRAVQRLDPERLNHPDTAWILKLASLGLRELAPHRATAVQVSSDGPVDVRIAQLESLPPAQAADLAREIFDEAARKAALVAEIAADDADGR